MAGLATYYDVLRVDRNATPDGIRRAYRRLAQQYHPDKLPGNANAGRAMAAINTAYDVLSDAEQRARHDHWIRKAETRPAPLAPVQQQSKWSRVWPWWLLFATIAFALLAVLATTVGAAKAGVPGGTASLLATRR
jgi:curved DNA-binding protein CbpA